MNASVRTTGVVAAVTAAALLAAGCSSTHHGKPGPSKPTASATPTPATSNGDTGTAAGLQAAYESVVHRVAPSVVEITTSSGLGSGIIYDAAGHIVTNDHVVGTATKFQVRLSSGGPALSAKLTGAYPGDDLAVIQLTGKHPKLQPAHFDTRKLTVGAIVLAVGNPLGLQGSVTDGIVSATGRTLTEPQSADSPGATLPDAIQTSAAINPGNSGGALVDLSAGVVGIPTLAAINPESGGGAAAPGIGFAIPSHIVTDIAGQLVKYGKVIHSHRAALGIEATDAVNPASGQPGGVGVVKVEPGSGAAKAGLKAGDIITAVNGTQMPDSETLTQYLATLKPGDQVHVTYTNPTGNSKTATVTLGQLPG